MSRRGRLTILLRREADDQADKATGEHDLEIVTTNSEARGQVSQQSADRQAKQEAERQRVKLLREEPNRNTRNDAFESRTNNDAGKLIAHSGRKPCRQAIKGAENCANNYSNQGFGHFISPNLASKFRGF